MLRKDYSFEAISRFHSLRILKIRSINLNISPEIGAKDLVSIAINCRQLEVLFIEIISRNSLNSTPLFESLINFSKLKRLSFLCKGSGIENNDKNRLDLNCLKNCQNLVYLGLELQTIDDKLLYSNPTNYSKIN